ncbi:MAG: hypothetical protein K6D03_08960 [Solobacterium sp.]|nr:hypothetical protein [Solobacterium sp.]
MPFNLKDNNKTYITIPSEDGFHYMGVFTSPDALNEFQAGFADTIPMETVIRAIVNDKTPGVNGICFDYNYKRPAICMQKEVLVKVLSYMENLDLSDSAI